MKVLIAILAIAVLLGLWLMSIYNRLVRLRNEVKNSWSQIDVQLQRRYDLIPNLVEAVKGYMGHERGTLDAVVKARSEAMQARDRIQQVGGPMDGSVKELAGAETALKGAVANLFALAENYPQLRASENMQQLQEELSSTENKVAFSRQAYNDSVLAYNTAIQEFPTVLVAGALNHRLAELFEVTEATARQAPKVQF
jgi:LemA protein